MHKILRLLGLSLLTTTVLLNACKSMEPNPDGTPPEGKYMDVNNTAKGAALGTLAGGGVGMLGGSSKSTAIGAAAGLAAGAAIGYYVDQSQEKIAEEIHEAGVSVIKKDHHLELVTPSNIEFAPKSTYISENYYPMLNAVALVLKQNPHSTLEIAGYTDDQGSTASNQQLSEKRAYNVATYLENQGILPDRLHVVGRGEHHPVQRNNTDHGRALNRRVELQLYTIPQRAKYVKPI